MIFSALLDRTEYTPALWDLTGDGEARRWWIRMFELQLDSMLELLLAQRGSAARDRALPVREAMIDFMQGADAHTRAQRPHAHAWTELREELLRKHGVEDPYSEVKADENTRALHLLPGVLRELRAAPSTGACCRLVLAGIFAGNLFDLGSPLTARAHREHGSRFLELRRDILERPWLIDHSAALSKALDNLKPAARVVILVDNAGPDFVCGTLPFAVWLAELGAEVVLAANELPALNDVTAAEARGLLEQVATMDLGVADLLRRNRLNLISTGTGSPGIDFRAVSSAFDTAAREAALLVLEGQGRALETNWLARFSLPVLRVSTLKDQLVAAALGGSVYDVVADFRDAYQPAPAFGNRLHA